VFCHERKVPAQRRRTQEILLGGSGKEPLEEEDASILVDTTIKADLRGISSHGISRLDHYIERMNKGLINPQAVTENRRES
jgi:LDH2 family malate/lactate/ureidoglycolate dehydrogenase